MNKILNWFEQYHSPIGYTVGGLNLLSGVFNMLTGNFYTGLLSIIAGAFITFDTWVSKQ